MIETTPGQVDLVQFHSTCALHAAHGATEAERFVYILERNRAKNRGVLELATDRNVGLEAVEFSIAADGVVHINSMLNVTQRAVIQAKINLSVGPGIVVVD